MSFSSADLYLGLDSSTQSLTAIVIAVDDNGARVVWEHSLAFDEALPHYGTRHGVLPSADPAVAVAPPQMWVDALDLMFDALQRSGLDLTRLRAIGGAAQQHGSVYLRADGTFARDVAPIWMDTSTTDECAEITAALRGPDVLAQRTGSRAFERFTGPQIRKFLETDPHGYAETSRVHLVSSFLASQLLGGEAPLDPGDASGMNLMDIRTCRWWPDAIEATAPGLATRLPNIVASDTIIGTLAPRWRERFALPAARLIAWTGDNPSSLVGVGLVAPGRVGISLGTSDTIFGPMAEPHVSSDGTGHVFGAPTGAWMGITVFKNGSLARERVRDRFGYDWAAFSRALEATPPGNGGALLLPWFEPEITPHVPAGGAVVIDLRDDDGPGYVRAVIEGQMLTMARHSQWMGVDVRVIRAMGGASASRAILQVMADVFKAEVRSGAVTQAAALGSALRAWHADRKAEGRMVAWTDVVALAALAPAVVVTPRPETRAVYQDAQARATALERRRLGAQ